MQFYKCEANYQFSLPTIVNRVSIRSEFTFRFLETTHPIEFSAKSKWPIMTRIQKILSKSQLVRIGSFFNFSSNFEIFLSFSGKIWKYGLIWPILQIFPWICVVISSNFRTPWNEPFSKRAMWTVWTPY